MVKEDDISDVVLFVLYDNQLQEVFDRIFDADRDSRFESAPWPFDPELVEATKCKLLSLMISRDEKRAR